ncbi:BPI fold-containing family C protein-like isoform X3 [Anser cygnoides]|uniref:BPI fold-containing family C protein-like isoform X3 n=1 Tax=Anser cygnoides TaxID=8845 RepID=UPI0034D344F1
MQSQFCANSRDIRETKYFFWSAVQKSLEEQYFMRYLVDSEFAAVWSLASSVTAQSQHRSPCDKGEKMLKMWYSLLLCLLFLQLEANPGLKVRITQKGLDYGRKIGMELLKQAVLKETFPGWSGQESFLAMKINYMISKLRIGAVDFPETAASFIPGIGISLSMAHASATISADWRMETWLLKDQGRITVSISGLFIAVIFKVSRDSTGHLSILLQNCQLRISRVKVKLNGGSSWIASFLSGYLEKPIQNKLDENLCLNIKYKIQMMDVQLRKHKVLSQIDAFAQIDYSLVSSPAVLKSHINLDLKITLHYVTACPVLLKLMATSPPVVSLQADRCSLQISGCVEVFAVLPNSTSQHIFTGNLTASTRVDLTITKQKLIISLLLKRLQFSLLNTTLGFSEVSLVKNFLSHALRNVVIPVINDKLGKGFPIPNFAHTTLIGPVIKMNQGHLLIFTDVHYKHEEGEDEDLHSQS